MVIVSTIVVLVVVVCFVFYLNSFAVANVKVNRCAVSQVITALFLKK